jgi:Flp pilus assembly protein TadD
MAIPFALNPNRKRAVICLALVLGTLLLYWPVTHHGFINIDDPRFVTENDHVKTGLTWSGIVWAFHSVVTENWQPLTWCSHMLDCQLYGLNPGGHHLTNLLFHLANTVLLFLWLDNLTRATWRSAFVAAFFAWHPLHVESVAWICERKDVLSTFFWMLALLAYTRYARKPGLAAYLLVLGLFGLGLMSKPMVVTLPCVLLLLDFWPLNRFAPQPVADGNLPEEFAAKTLVRRSVSLLVEKIPFFILALAIGVITILAQKAGGVLAPVNGLPLHDRLATALVGYLDYLRTTFWPTGLACFYPYAFDLPLALVLGAALLLLVWTGWFLLRARQQPYLLMGWLWFLGTLAPTIGLVQVCIQARADRYMYIPSIGLFIVVVWGLSDLFERRPARKNLLPVLGGLALGGCVAVTSVVLGYWQDSVTLARHAIDVTSDNYVAYESLGRALYERGLKQGAMECYVESLRINPGFPQAQFNLAVALVDAGRSEEAVEHFAAAAQALPTHYEIRDQLGTVLLSLGDNRLAEAARQFAEVLRQKPDDADAQSKLALVLVRQGQVANALPHFAEAVRLEPANPESRFNFGLALLSNHQPAEAAAQFAEEVRLTPHETKVHYRLAQALQQDGKPGGAVQEYRAALELTPDFPEAKTALDQLLAVHPDLK